MDFNINFKINARPITLLDEFSDDLYYELQIKLIFYCYFFLISNKFTFDNPFSNNNLPFILLIIHCVQN